MMIILKCMGKKITMFCNRNQGSVGNYTSKLSAITLRKRDQICGYQRWGGGACREEDLGKGSQKIQISSYKINKY